jgi:hypothetical protein
MVKARKFYVWKDPSRLAMAAIAAMAVSIVVRSFSLLVEVTNGDAAIYAASDTELSDAQSLMALADALQLVVLVCCVSVALWIARVCRNAHVFRSGLKNSPLGAVGWYFVPVACLFKPYEAMSEIWSASSAPGQRDKSRLLNWWWGLFLVSNVVGTLSVRMNFTPLSIVDDLLAIGVSAILVVMVRRLSRMQRDKYAVWDVFDAPDPEPAGVLQRVTG